MENTILSARQLNLYYGENHALKDICIQIPEHRSPPLSGPSGCGKSTFLPDHQPDERPDPGVKIGGSLFYRGEDIYAPARTSPTCAAASAWCSRSPIPFPCPSMSNVAYGPRTHGIRSKVKLDELVEGVLRGRPSGTR